MQTVYYEKAIKRHPRVLKIIERVGKQATMIECEHYGEVFNPKSQNFRIQKQNPALILAQKSGKCVMPTPEGFGIGGKKNYYFSHILNCPYDCRYCFLQGLYPSAHYVIFVNYEDFQTEITRLTFETKDQVPYFFSGYDGDSLAFDAITGFVQDFLPFFEKLPAAMLELRTKSANVQSLLNIKPIENCVVAFSLTPEAISRAVEHKTPVLEKRLKAMRQLSEAGWRIGLRFDPLIYCEQFSEHYQRLAAQIFKDISIKSIHSVSIGPLRFPQAMYQKIIKLYPKDKLLAHPLYKRNKQYSYRESLEKSMKESVLNILRNYLPNTLLFECNVL